MIIQQHRAPVGAIEVVKDIRTSKTTNHPMRVDDGRSPVSLLIIVHHRRCTRAIPCDGILEGDVEKGSRWDELARLNSLSFPLSTPSTIHFGGVFLYAASESFQNVNFPSRLIYAKETATFLVLFCARRMLTSHQAQILSHRRLLSRLHPPMFTLTLNPLPAF